MNSEKNNGQFNKVYKNPVIFQMFENHPIFEAYNPDQLQDALFELDQYYSFSKDK